MSDPRRAPARRCGGERSAGAGKPPFAPLPPFPPLPPSDRTVAEFIAEWLEFKKLTASSTTVQGYTDERNLYALPRKAA